MSAAAQPRFSLGPALMRAWTRRGPLALLLWPLSVLYGWTVELRRRAFKLGFFKSHRVSAPVLIVGNVLAGGAGKTPVVMALTMHLTARGIQVGVVSRGYGRLTRDCREVFADANAGDTGDESLLVKRNTHAPVFVAPKRHEAAAALLAAYPNTRLIICDDGLQHYALQRDLEICVFDRRGIGNGFLLPAGPLREPWPRKVDFVLSAEDSTRLAGAYSMQRRLADYALRADGTRIPLVNLVGKPLSAVAAIAQPEAFFAMLRQEGLALEHAIALPDHYDFNNWSPPSFVTEQLICTEKDAVKLWPTRPEVLALPLTLVLDPDFQNAFDAAIDALCKPKR